MRLARVVGLLASSALALACASSSAHPAPHAVVRAPEDVTMVLCRGSAVGMTAQLTVVNHSTWPSSYLVTVDFDSSTASTTHFGTGVAAVGLLEPGQTILNVTADLPVRDLTAMYAQITGAFSCTVSDVKRYELHAKYHQKNAPPVIPAPPHSATSTVCSPQRPTATTPDMAGVIASGCT